MSLSNLSYEQTDWNTETKDNDQILDATDFQDSIPYSDGSAWTGKSTSELKTLLGISSESKIVCYGDSLTYGTGGTSYPSQLATLLDATVVNTGIGGDHSANIRDRF